MLKGIDISTWQAVGTGDGDYDFVIVKATGADAGMYVDSKCDAHYQRAKSQGKLLGVYHFAKPSTSSAEAQAKFFVDNIKGYIGEAILVLDWEEEVHNVAWAKAWLDKVKELTGVAPMIYMSASVVNGCDWSSVANANYGLWIAGYPLPYNVLTPPTPRVEDMPFSLGAWKFWAIWQYSSSAGTLDRDIANMDKQAWKKYAAKEGTTPSPAPVPSPKPKPAPTPRNYVEYTVAPGDTLSAIAAKFGTTYQKIAADNGISDPNLIYPNQVLKIYGSSNGGNGAEYYTIQPGDTLSAIAVRFGTTVDQLVRWNSIANPNLIYPNTKIRVR